MKVNNPVFRIHARCIVFRGKPRLKTDRKLFCMRENATSMEAPL